MTPVLAVVERNLRSVMVLRSMSSDMLSAIISLFVAIAVLLAGFFQWWGISYNGRMRTRLWVKLFFGICLISLVISIILLLRS